MLHSPVRLIRERWARERGTQHILGLVFLVAVDRELVTLRAGREAVPCSVATYKGIGLLWGNGSTSIGGMMARHPHQLRTEA